MTLTSKQRAHLRGLSHSLKPTAHVGKDGVTPAVVRSLLETFQQHELVKVRVLENAPDSAKSLAHEIAEKLAGAHVVQTMGRNVTLYRPDPEEPTIALPR
ncbi:YhbY family RNA-binding protein [Rubrivirga sp.]|uniref:YhbY family RNA-binding protein n=1 Tax=Rubrivirga sp. TaxID=1885344 RepID=UPI003C73BEEA